MTDVSRFSSDPQTDENLRWYDGNVLGGPLSDLLAFDVTIGTGQCVGCGQTGPLAQLRVFGGAHGLVARCPRCDAVLVQFVHGPNRTWLSLEGLRYIEVDTANAESATAESVSAESGSSAPFEAGTDHEGPDA